METRELLELAIIKSQITPSVVSSIKKVIATLNATGCFIEYRDKKFLITVKHSFAESLVSGDSVQIEVCRDKWYRFKGVLYKHSDADVAAIQITTEGFLPKNYIRLSDEQIEPKSGDIIVILGYQNLYPSSCLEKPMLQKSYFKSNIDKYQDLYSGVAIPGYSGSPIIRLTQDGGSSIELIGLLSKSNNQLFYLGANKQERQEGDEIMIEKLKVISPSRFAILETLNLSFDV